MCDYSLHNVASRAARLGDKLVTTNFRGTATRGFADHRQRAVAVCLLPGTELSFDDNQAAPRGLRAVAAWFEPISLRRRVAAGTSVTFRKLDTDTAHIHHDAIELPDGSVLRLNDLAPGQRVTVLQLPAGQKNQTTAGVPAQLVTADMYG
jgi:hypothetical protein